MCHLAQYISRHVLCQSEGLRPKDQESQSAKAPERQPGASARPNGGGSTVSHVAENALRTATPARSVFLHCSTTRLRKAPLAPDAPPQGGWRSRHTRHQPLNGFQPFSGGRPTIRVKKRSSRNNSHGYAGSLVPRRPIYPDWSGLMLCEAAMALRPLRWAHPREGPLGWRLFHSRTNGCFQNGNNHYSLFWLFWGVSTCAEISV